MAALRAAVMSFISQATCTSAAVAQSTRSSCTGTAFTATFYFSTFSCSTVAMRVVDRLLKQPGFDCSASV